jgi:hypothetical protein
VVVDARGKPVSTNPVDNKNNPFEVQESEKVDDRDMPIFITYIWKRSCMAFMMYMNALMMTIVMEFSFSNIYTNNVLAMQLVLYVFRVLSDLAFVGFVKEVQILLPINVVQQVVGVVSTM